MKLSQLTYVMEKDENIVINTVEDVPVTEKCLYHGTVRGINKDNPLNRAHVCFVMAVDNDILVEVSPEGRGR